MINVVVDQEMNVVGFSLLLLGEKNHKCLWMSSNYVWLGGKFVVDRQMIVVSQKKFVFDPEILCG